ncbi:thioesterase II family protein [Cellulomonas telluris]|uniref:thioesterase II family protein n=1 Tax=Cellulomonas telluris TaxID=2306636 RepID=UPI0014562C48|nr:thioesterase [Cellulomonas telluris]
MRDDADEGTGRLLCLPPAGAGAAFFRSWPAEVAGLRTTRVDPPGRGAAGGRPARATVEEAAAEVADDLGRPPRRWAVFGLSYGAALAFALVHELRRRHGVEPDVLVVAGRHAPHLPLPRPPIGDLPGRAFLDAVLGYGGTAPEVAARPDVLAAVEPVLRADVRAAERYRWPGGDPLTCPVTAVAATGDALVTASAAGAWAAVTTGPFRVVHVAGDHFHAREPSPALVAALAGDVR